MAHKFRTAAIGFSVGLIIAGCSSTNSGTTKAQPESSTSPKDAPKTTPPSLPVPASFASRSNSKNNGSPYEPCIAVSPDVARQLGLDPATIGDVATIPRDGVRGCKWRNHGRNPDWTMTQAVSNWSSLAAFRDFNLIGTDWQPTQTIHGREVGIYRELAGTSLPSCTTYVQSGQAGIITMVTNAFRPTSQFDECAKAIEATTAVIDQIPR